jgi:hypothetical protein
MFVEQVWCTLVDEASTHVNRYIRAVSFEFIDSVISTSRNAGESLGDNIQRIVTALSAGLVVSCNNGYYLSEEFNALQRLYSGRLEPGPLCSAETHTYFPAIP